MKSLKEILTESKKTYSWKIGLAGDLPENINEHLRTHLEKFGIVNMSSGKKTPLQERPLDFPNLQNTEVHYWDVEVEYPTTEAIIKEYLGYVCSVHPSHIVVRNPNEPIERIQKIEEKETYEPLLSNPDMGGISAQGSVGSARVMDLLKELETARKESSNQSGFKMESTKEPQNSKSVLGNKK